jgi:hypothetical protein
MEEVQGDQVGLRSHLLAWEMVESMFLTRNGSVMEDGACGVANGHRTLHYSHTLQQQNLQLK